MKLIFFQGPPKSGKDTVCDILINLYPNKFNKLSAKTQLFSDTCDFYSVSMSWFLHDYDINKDNTHDCLGGISKRQALIHVSENIMKPKYGNDYYGNSLISQLNPNKINILSDCGFIEEMEPLIHRYNQDEVCIVRVSKSGTSYVRSGDSRRYIYTNTLPTASFGMSSIDEPLHSFPEWSKSNIGDVKTFVIYNNGTLGELEEIALRFSNFILR